MRVLVAGITVIGDVLWQEFLCWVIQQSLGHGVEACHAGLWQQCIVMVQAAARLLAGVRSRGGPIEAGQAAIPGAMLVSAHWMVSQLNLSCVHAQSHWQVDSVGSMPESMYLAAVLD
jgi:hypothetical protein